MPAFEILHLIAPVQYAATKCGSYISKVQPDVEVLAIALLPLEAAPEAPPSPERATGPPAREIPVTAPHRRKAPPAPRA